MEFYEKTKIIFVYIYEEKNLHCCSLCPLRPGWGGAKGLSGKNVSFFFTTPLALLRKRKRGRANFKMYMLSRYRPKLSILIYFRYFIILDLRFFEVVFQKLINQNIK